MKKEKEYKRWFSAEVIRQAIAAFEALMGQRDKVSCKYRVSSNGESWSYDTAGDFFEAYDDAIEDAKYAIKAGEYSLYVSYSSEMNSTKIGVGSPDRKEIEEIFRIFETDG